MKKLTITVLSTLTFLILLACFVLFTQPGLRFLVMLSQRALQERHITLQPKQIHGTLHQFTIDKMNIALPPMTLTFTTVSARWHLHALLEGKVDIEQLTAQQVQITDAEGKVEKNLGQLSGRLYSSKTQLYFQTTLQRNKYDHVILNGKINNNSPYQFQLSADAKAAIGYHQLSATATVSGTLNQYQVNGSLYWQKNQYRYVDLKVKGEGTPNHLTLNSINGTLNDGALTGAGSLDWQKTLLWQLTLNGQNIKAQWQDPTLPTLGFSLKTEKTEQNELISLDATSGTWRLQLGQTGALVNQQWRYSLDTLSLGSLKNLWSIPHASVLTIAPKDFRLPSTCLQHSNESICLEAAWQPTQWNIQLHSTPLSLRNFPSPFNGLRIYGQTQVEMQATQLPNKPLSAKATLDIAQLTLKPTLQLSLYNRNSNQLEIQTGHLTASIDQGTLTSQLTLNFSPKNQLQGSTVITHMNGLWPNETNSWVTTDLNITLQNVGILNDLMPQLANLQGQLTGSLSMNSAFNNPLYLGELKLTHASADIPVLGLQLKQGNINLNSVKQGKFTLTGQVQSGAGDLSFDGQWQTGQHQNTLSIKINGSQVTLVDLPQLMMVASPTLIFTQTPELESLTGNINIDQATINADLIQRQSQASEDVVLVNGNDQAVRDTPTIPFSSELTIQAIKAVTFKGFGINTQITGKVNLSLNPQQTWMANGTLTANSGDYSAYGKIFNITNGSLVFNNSALDNPSLNVTALYQLNNQTQSTELSHLQVGVTVYGTVTHPQLRLFSNPSMSQEDILSYIVLGVPLNQAQPGDTGSLSTAALSFALSGGSNTVFNNIQHSLGLSQLSVGTLDDRYGISNSMASNTTTNGSSSGTAQDNTAIFVGKSIGSRFSVSYGVGLFNSQQEVRTQYQLSRRWQVQTDSSNVGSGADLIYTIDR